MELCNECYYLHFRLSARDVLSSRSSSSRISTTPGVFWHYPRLRIVSVISSVANNQRWHTATRQSSCYSDVSTEHLERLRFNPVWRGQDEQSVRSLELRVLAARWPQSPVGLDSRKDSIQSSTAIEEDALGQPPKKRVKRSTHVLRERLFNLCCARRDNTKSMHELLHGVARTIRFS